jgi:hypothetical protein
MQNPDLALPPHPRTALEELTSAHIKELSQYINPPTNVKMVNAAVMAALGHHETWEMGKKVMK